MSQEMRRRQESLLAVLIEHIEAWNSHDLERLMSLFGEGCIFEASSGESVDGKRYIGLEEVRAAFAGVFKRMPDAQLGNGSHWLIDHTRGVSKWTLSGTLDDGRRIEVNGCDFLTVEYGLIVRKDSYRKQRTPIDG